MSSGILALVGVVVGFMITELLLAWFPLSKHERECRRWQRDNYRHWKRIEKQAARKTAGRVR